MIAVADTPTDLERFVTLLWRPGDVREVRIPGPRGTDSGYFDDPAALAAAVRRYDGRANLYVTLNPVEPALLARAANRIRPRARSTTADAQVVERRWLPVDIDPVRPTDVVGDRRRARPSAGDRPRGLRLPARGGLRPSRSPP